MRFKAPVAHLNTFIKVISSLSLLGPIAWMRLDDNYLRFTVIPELGSQVWAVLPIYTIFSPDYSVQSNSPNNVINMEVPLGPLLRALKTAQDCNEASLRLTKKDGQPLLCLTIDTTIQVTNSGRAPADGGDTGLREMIHAKDATISQDVPVRLLPATSVEGIHEPRCQEPEVMIMLPPLSQIKAVSDRFTRIALTANKTQAQSSGLQAGSTGVGQSGIRLELKANMHGEFNIAIRTDALEVETRWNGLTNPELDPSMMENGEDGIEAHPSTRWRERGRDESWAVVRVEGKDWGRVLGVGRLGGRVVACFCHDHALIIYVYLPSREGGGEETCITYYIGSYSE